MDKRVYMLTVIAFVAGMSELIVSGILDLIATDLNIRISTAGLLITVFAVFYGVSAPVLLVLLAKVERKKLILLSLIVFLIGNIFAIFSVNFTMLLISRIISAASGSIATVLSINIASRVVKPAYRGRAIGLVVMGISGSLVLGLPIGVFLGNLFNWRAPFIAIALFTMLLIIVTNRTLGKIAPAQVVSLRKQVITLKNIRISAAHLTSFFFLAGHLTFNGYLTPYVKEVLHFDGMTISIMYLIFGIAAVSGSGLAGISADRLGIRKTLLFVIVILTISLFFIPYTTNMVYVFWFILIVWGIVSWGISPPIQSHLFSIATETSDIQQSLNNAALQLGIAFGTLFGGFVIERSSLQALPHAGIVFVILAFVAMMISTREPKEKRTPVSSVE